MGTTINQQTIPTRDIRQHLIDTAKEAAKQRSRQLLIKTKLFSRNVTVLVNKKSNLKDMTKAFDIVLTHVADVFSMEPPALTTVLIKIYNDIYNKYVAKHNSKTAIANVSQNSAHLHSTPTPSINSLNKPEQQTVRTPAIKIVSPTEMEAIKVDATQKLGDVLYEHFSTSNSTLATNIRESFFRDLEYDSSSLSPSVKFNLRTILALFSEYLKVESYGHLYLNGTDYFMNNLNDRLLRCNIEC